MRRRFGRRRRRDEGASREGGIDAAHWFRVISEDDSNPLERLEPVTVEGLPSTLAVVAEGRDAGGTRVRVAFSPTCGGDAWLGALAAGPFDGEVIALAPHWSAGGRRRLELAGPATLEIAPRLVPALAAGASEVRAEVEPGARPISLENLATRCRDSEQRALFMRAGEALRGLAAKFDGVARGSVEGYELVLQGKRIAQLRVESGVLRLRVAVPREASLEIDVARLADAFDDLDAGARKWLAERRTRNGEEGLRARVAPLLASALALEAFAAWPYVGSDPDVLDLAGVDREGRVGFGASREALSLPGLGEILDAYLGAAAIAPAGLPTHALRVRSERPRLVIAAREIDPGVASALAALALDAKLFEVRSHRSRGLELFPVGIESESTGAVRDRPAPRRTPAQQPAEDLSAADDSNDLASEAIGLGESSEATAPGERAPGARSRRRRGGRGRRGRSSESDLETRDTEREGETRGEEVSGEPIRFDDLSMTDLEDESRDGARSGSGHRSRRRGRRGSRREEGSEEAAADREAGVGGPSPVPTEAVSTRKDEALSVDSDADADADADADVDELLAPLPEGVSDGESEKRPEYEDDESGVAPAAEREAPVEAPAEAPTRPRRRSAILAAADRDSVMAAVLLARDIRQVEGIWVYPQEELMTFFRGVAIDLREGTPIYVIGFTPSPAREVIQAAALYSDRLFWFDHHDWPPEDALALRQVIGEESVQLAPGTGSSIPGVLSGAVRRSRFTDKLVDLAAGRFTEHDFEKWGRLWWHRIGEIAGRLGDRRADLESLLAGRPSELAKEAARAATPPPPAEVAYVSERDMRLVHFSNHSLVIVEAPSELDVHLLGRIARERYDATLSLASSEGSETWILTGEELSGRRSLDVGALADHLATKYRWVESLPGDDRVARLRIEDLASQPHRLDEVIGGIAMGRSILDH
ncbi:MAG: hypothetical protein VCC68_07245 [Myxococcota bacterium]